MKKIFTLLIGISFSMTILNSQVAPPQAFSLKATIKGSNGQQVPNRTIRLRISILQNNTNGIAVYSEYFTPTTDANSQVDLQIGKGTVLSGSFSSIGWSTDLYFLKIEVDVRGGTNYQVLSATQLLSVPYAMYAGKAGSALDAVTITGNQTITGIKTFSHDLLVNGVTIGMGKSSSAYNTAIGAQSLFSNTTGQNNTAVGNRTLYNNLDGTNNTATGNSALGSNTSGSGNTANGEIALLSNKTGVQNTAFGYVALRLNTTGSFNTAIGTGALQNNIDGTYNTAIGNVALTGKTTGSNNTAVGTSAGTNNTTGNNNVFLGSSAGYYETGSNKLFIDNQQRASESDARNKALIYGVFDNDPANQVLTINGKVGINTLNPAYKLDVSGDINFTGSLYKNGSPYSGGGSDTAIVVTIKGNQTITGIKTFTKDVLISSLTIGRGKGSFISNTAIGGFAISSNTTGIWNTAIGDSALYSNTTGSYNTANGAKALFSNTKGQWNTATGDSALNNNTVGIGNNAFGSSALNYNTLGNGNTAVGNSALYNNTVGNENTAIGDGALGSNTLGNDNTAIGAGAGAESENLTNATAIGFTALVNASNKVVIGNSNVTSIGGYANWTNYSDKRLKENIIYKNDLGLNFISKLKTVSYNYKADQLKHRRDGLIAQDVDRALKDLGLQFSGLVIDDDKNKTENLSYGDFVIPLINAVQEQQKQIEALQKQIDELKKLVGTLAQK